MNRKKKLKIKKHFSKFSFDVPSMLGVVFLLLFFKQLKNHCRLLKYGGFYH